MLIAKRWTSPLLTVSSSGAGKVEDFATIRERNENFFEELEREEPYPSNVVAKYLTLTEPDLMESVGSVGSRRLSFDDYLRVKLAGLYREKYDGRY